MRQADRFDEINNDLVYVGYLKTDLDNVTVDKELLPVWHIRKHEQVGTVWSITLADGDLFFDNVWNDRLKLEYR